MVGFGVCKGMFWLPAGGQVLQLIMEYLPLGSLKEYLPKQRLGVAHSLLFAQQICQVSSPSPIGHYRG